MTNPAIQLTAPRRRMADLLAAVHPGRWTDERTAAARNGVDEDGSASILDSDQEPVLMALDKGMRAVHLHSHPGPYHPALPTPASARTCPTCLFSG
jgi:hypothetical protein